MLSTSEVAVSRLNPRPAAVPKDLAGGALRTFFRIASLWGLSDEECQILLATPRSTLARWKNAPSSARLGRDTLERLSYLFNIYGDLQIVLPDPAAADTWIRRPNRNPIFNGQTPLQRMLGGNVADLYMVSQYTAAWRGGKS